MGALLLRRAAAVGPLLVVVSFLTFALLDASGGDYASRLARDPAVSDALLAQVRAVYGLDKPLLERYGRWAWGALRGDLGWSFDYQCAVGPLLLERVGNTLLLALTSLAIAWGFAIPLGVLSAVHQGTWLDKAAGLVAYLGLSMPRVFLSLLAVLLAFRTGLFPIGGLRDEVAWDGLSAWGRAADVAWHLCLPALVLGLTNMAATMRQMRGYTIETLAQDYVRTARAKGLPERTVLFKHVVRNAINPLVTLFGYSVANLVTGSFLVEVVFAWPGMARLTLTALLARDVNLVMASVVLASVMLVLGNLLADLLLAAVDPRIRVA